MARNPSAYVPRDFLENAEDFGRAQAPRWRRPADLREAGELGASQAQHRAALVVRSMRDRGDTTVRDLAESLGVDEGYLSGQLNGAYPASLADMIRWAVALDDVSIVPVVESLADLRP